jgi:hypothetical protein
VTAKSARYRNAAHGAREESSFVISRYIGHNRTIAPAYEPTVLLFERLERETTVMSTNKAFSASRGTSIRTKAIIAVIAVVFALLYAKGVTLMIDAADTPGSYTTFLHHAD